jgi:hypothetical protein
MQKHEQCMFCAEKESTDHMFFECGIAWVVWSYANEFLDMSLGTDYIFVASKWLSKKKFEVVNIISTTVLKWIWLTRNAFMFNNQG